MDEQTRLRLDYLETWIRRLADIHEHEFRTAARARDTWSAELDALIAEVQVMQIGHRHLEQRVQHLEGIMTNDERAQLLGNDLTRATEALIGSCFPGKDPKVVGDFLAELLGRATALASGAVVGVHTIAADANAVLESRIEALEADVAELKERQVGGDG